MSVISSLTEQVDCSEAEDCVPADETVEWGGKEKGLPAQGRGRAHVRHPCTGRLSKSLSQGIHKRSTEAQECKN